MTIRMVIVDILMLNGHVSVEGDQSLSGFEVE